MRTISRSWQIVLCAMLIGLAAGCGSEKKADPDTRKKAAEELKQNLKKEWGYRPLARFSSDTTGANFMILKHRDFVIAFVPATFVAAVFLLLNRIPAWDFKPPRERMEIPKKKQVYGWPRVERWTEWETANYPEFYGDGRTWENPFVEPEWFIWGDDEDGEAYAYNYTVGLSIAFLTWILAAAISASGRGLSRPVNEIASAGPGR